MSARRTHSVRSLVMQCYAISLHSCHSQSTRVTHITRQPRSPQRSMWVYCAAQGMLQELLDPSPLKNKTQHCKWERGVGLASQTTAGHALILPPIIRSPCGMIPL